MLDSLDSLCAVTAWRVSYGAEIVRFFDIRTSNRDVPVAIPDVSIRDRTIRTEVDVPSWILGHAGRPSFPSRPSGRS